jgi:8-oxo-dGTP pyrophosphatase MutT (NUDIX family)
VPAQRPRLAATVILARPASPPASGLEIYMTRRSARSTFAPDAFVFPGGTVDERFDRTPAITARTLGLESARVRRDFQRARVPAELPSGEPAADFAEAAGVLIAALRELFEEAGILIARTRAGSPVEADRVHEDGAHAQRALLQNGRLAFADFLQERDWFADAGALTFFSHWITPPSEPRRYNTHFFFAPAPREQAGRADAFETHDGIWITPRDALVRHRRGDFHLVYPTIKHLERLTSFDSVDAALEFARAKPILTIMPGTSPDEGFVMPTALENAW